MISFDLNFFPRENTRGDELGQFHYELSSFIMALGWHGNTVGDSFTLELQDRIHVRVQCLAPDALNESNMSEYAQKYIDQVRQLSQHPPEFLQLSEKSSEQTWCDCQSPSFRLLYSHWDRLISPVLCGDCWRGVPLYRLPLLDNPSRDHSELMNWLNTRENFEGIWLHSGAGEREAYRQLARPRSPFMKWTRDLAEQLEAKTGVPTYAFLKHYYKKWYKHCPRCQRNWKWKGPGKIRFRCEHCRIISEKPTDYRTPLRNLHP